MKRTYSAGFFLTVGALFAVLIGVSVPIAGRGSPQGAAAAAAAPAQTPAAAPAAAPAPTPAQAAVVVASAAMVTPGATPVTRPVDYNWDIRPILSDYCFRCHGPDEQSRQAGLRLDTAAGAYAALRRPGTFAIVPGRPEASQLMFRVTHANAVVRMPPTVANKVLSAQQIELLRTWIAQGAEYKPHWAFTAPQQAAVPVGAAGPSVRNAIDQFVQARLAREGLRLSAPADKETLINRVTLTLTGLPPTLAEVDAFLQDTRPQAYETLVDRLLASPAYGEHAGQQWLDIARYAESDGFLDDTHDRLLWPYRDWVIKALNQNMPFNQFATWQLAGDLLPSHTKEQLLATAFMRAGKRSTENGAIDEEYRVEYAVDRAVTVGTGFLAMTVGCARCHDHKYDPIPTKDFYSLTGFFNSIDEPGFYAPGRSGTTPGPAMLWTDEATEKEIATQRAAIVKAEGTYDAARQSAAHRVASRADALLQDPAELRRAVEHSLSTDLQGHYPFEATEPIPADVQPEPVPQARLSPPPLAPQSLSPRCFRHESDIGCRTMRTGMARLVDSWRTEPLVISSSTTPGAPPAVLLTPILRDGVAGKAFYFDDNNRGVLGQNVGYFERTQPFSIDLWMLPGAVYDEALVFSHREADNAGNAGYILRLMGNKLWFDIANNRAGNGIAMFTKEPLPVGQWAHVTLTYDGSSRAKGLTMYLNGVPADVEVYRDNLSRTIIPNGDSNAGDDVYGVQFGQGGRIKTLKDGALDEMRVYTRALTPFEVRVLHEKVKPAASGEMRPSRQDLVDLLVTQDAEVKEALATLVASRNIENETVSLLPQVLVMGDLPKPRPTYVLVRGNYEDHGEQIPPRGLNEVLAWNPAWPENRLGLAQWLFDPKNPLTARVFVNRAWQSHFGRGLVETSEDFGSQGSLPTHPELLDYLAVTFRDSGWDIKKLHRLIVMSGTYRQQSDAREDLLQKDPDNLLLARFTRIRMPAEMVRDQALAASGLLVNRVGGPSVYPYQPPNMWDGFNQYDYPTPDRVPADAHHRRSMYSFIKRNAPHPSMATFDLPDRGGSTARRRTSNSPLQALVLLDDPQFLEAYRALAGSVIRAETTADARLTRVFRLATRRHPLAAEMTAMRDYHNAQLERYAADREAAVRLLNVGVTPVDSSLDPVQLAALTNLTTVVMNTPDAYSLR